MINDFDSEKFLYKIKKWGELHPDVKFVLYTDYSTKESTASPFDFTIVAVVEDTLDFTRKLDWVNYFGQTARHLLHTDDGSYTVEADYTKGPKVKFVLFGSSIDLEKTASSDSKVLVNKS